MIDVRSGIEINGAQLTIEPDDQQSCFNSYDISAQNVYEIKLDTNLMTKADITRVLFATLVNATVRHNNVDIMTKQDDECLGFVVYKNTDRGKWMTIDILDEKPIELTEINGVIHLTAISSNNTRPLPICFHARAYAKPKKDIDEDTHSP